MLNEQNSSDLTTADLTDTLYLIPNPDATGPKITRESFAGPTCNELVNAVKED